ncbi:NrtR DNA-binding winged helix domain-containing protein [Pseudovibrio ascidiaceicola]|uniref:NUDIX hydrolase n=1 Tax=Pseudovibrio ascidiaceicola TaxID=285279 RepID=UPI000D685B84
MSNAVETGSAAQRGADMEPVQLGIGLNAVIVSVKDKVPFVLTVPQKVSDELSGLPSGPFDPRMHRTFELGLRAFVEEQTALHIGHVEQLYTFGDRDRYSLARVGEPHMVSVGYLALTRQTPESERLLARQGARWRPWYDFFPWEDWRGGQPKMLEEIIHPSMETFTKAPDDDAKTYHELSRKDRYQLAFGVGSLKWDEERVLDRYELLYGSGLMREALRDKQPTALERGTLPDLGEGLAHDHRRILATALSRLRAKLKYRPVVFELMPPEFTLTDLQQTVEAISGRHIHKQNFRRLVETGQLVEQTGRTSTATGGRPAALYRFRRDILKERPAPGLRVSLL